MSLKSDPVGSFSEEMIFSSFDSQFSEFFEDLLRVSHLLLSVSQIPLLTIVFNCPLHLFSKCNVSRASLFPSCLLASCPLASNLQIIFFTLSWYHFLSHSFIWRPLISEIFALTMIKKQKSKVYQSKVLVACQNMSNKWHLRELKCKQIICKLWRYSLFYGTLKGKGA